MSNPAFRAVQRALLRIAMTVATLLVAVSPARAATADVDSRERAVVHRINEIRAQHGLGALNLDDRVSRAADRHSGRMARARTLAHQVWGEGSLSGRLRWATGDAKVGETIFWGHGGVRSAEIVRAWMHSSGHRALLLSGSFSKAGIGIRQGGGGFYATVDLASS